MNNICSENANIRNFKLSIIQNQDIDVITVLEDKCFYFSYPYRIYHNRMQTLTDYNAVKHMLSSGVLLPSEDIRLDFKFSNPLNGMVTFKDLRQKKQYTGSFELTTRIKQNAYNIRITFPESILKSRMPQLNYTIADVKHLKEALTHVLIRNNV